jgi:hypothetical protein
VAFAGCKKVAASSWGRDNPSIVFIVLLFF